MALLPWGLSRILGISVYLDIPADTAWWAAIAGVVLIVVGVLVVALGALVGAGTPEQRARLRPADPAERQRFCPMSQSRSGRPSIASDTARAWSSESDAT